MRKLVINLAVVPLLVFVVMSCGSGSSKNSNVNTDSTKTKVQKSNLDLLQGKWRNTDDTTNFLVFEKNHRKEIAAGMGKWDDEEFVLSYKCINESDKNLEIQKEKERYISLVNSDMCWCIVDLDDHSLTLSYMSRGNTLNYTRAE
jgi:hypothetical protein